MYGENAVDDIKKFGKAILSNQVARTAPKFYASVTKYTGRGYGKFSPLEVAQYFQERFDEYFKKLEINKSDIRQYLSGKRLLEYYPGDVPGVAILMYAHGAEHITCINRFPLITHTDTNVEIMSELINNLEGEARKRVHSCFLKSNDPGSGVNTSAIEYIVKPQGSAGLESQIDMVYSGAALEHVTDLDATFIDMYKMLVPGGVAIHQVDLKSHGMHRKNSLDFLTWPQWMWELMYSHKGVPNRWRINRYREIIEQSAFELALLEPISLYSSAIISEVKPYLIEKFKHISDEDLAWAAFWLVLHKKIQN